MQQKQRIKQLTLTDRASAESAGTVPFFSTIVRDQRPLNGWTGYKLKVMIIKGESGQVCLAAEETKQLHKQIEQQLKLQVTLWQPVMGQVSCRWFEEG
ncbi:hypothetical protein QVD17_38109 [Tagetes erecta]|uniref:Uncharacterized protein n=1 Tax=Tagetes erecta TaxID=13708 RepID=A0AAD8NJ48_TARER|nr:hypothetical protein QVD17_38109 [Tagetes erecta]